MTYERYENACLWIAIPTVQITDSSKFKSVRLAGWFLTLPLYPLMIVGLVFIFVGLVFCIIRDI